MIGKESHHKDMCLRALTASTQYNMKHTERVCFIYIFHQDNPCPVSKDWVHFLPCLTDCNGHSSMTFIHTHTHTQTCLTQILWQWAWGLLLITLPLFCSWISKEDAWDSPTYQTHTKTHAPAPVWPVVVSTHTQLPDPSLLSLSWMWPQGVDS